MSRKLALSMAVAGGFLLMSAGKADDAKLLEEARKYFEPLPEVAESKENPVTPEKVELGKMLYYEPRLSKSGWISCNSCHNIATYGVDNLPTSIGHRVLNPIEMAMDSPEAVVERLRSIPEYVELFKKAFPGEKDPLNYDNVARAIAAFERTLMTPSRFDKFLKGDVNALTRKEKEGLRIFMELGCASCHNGPAVGGNTFAKFGVVEAYWEATRDFVTLDKPTMPMDVGRFAVTHKKEDLYIFKVPSLRNISRTYPYFHDGSVWNLEDAVQVMAKVQLGKELTEDQVDKIVAFLKALDGEIPKHALELPVLPPSTPKTSRPIR